MVGTVFALCVLEHGKCWSQCGRTSSIKIQRINYTCDCRTCSSNSCRSENLDVNWLQSHFLCPKQPPLYSDHNYNQWKCIELKCDACFLHKPSIILCDRFGFADDTNVIKWEQLNYTRTTCGDSFALCTRGAKAKTKLGAKRRYNHWILQRLCVSSSRTVHALNLTKSRMTAIAELFMAWMQIPSF